MVDNAQNPRSSYAEGIKWALALSIAAVAGAFLHLSDLSKLPFCLRVVAAVDTVSFLAAAFFGVQYLIRLFTDDVRRQQVSGMEGNISATDAEKARAEDVRKKLARSDASRPKLYFLQTVFSCIAVALAFVFLPAAILTFKDDSKKPDHPCTGTTACQGTSQIQPTPERFTIVYSAVHPDRGTGVQHTFLLDKQMGTLWQMICEKSGAVAFQEIPRKKAP